MVFLTKFVLDLLILVIPYRNVDERNFRECNLFVFNIEQIFIFYLVNYLLGCPVLCS